MLTIAYCYVVGLGLGLDLVSELVGGYAHVFVPLSVVAVTPSQQSNCQLRETKSTSTPHGPSNRRRWPNRTGHLTLRHVNLDLRLILQRRPTDQSTAHNSLTPTVVGAP